MSQELRPPLAFKDMTSLETQTQDETQKQGLLSPRRSQLGPGMVLRLHSSVARVPEAAMERDQR